MTSKYCNIIRTSSKMSPGVDHERIVFSLYICDIYTSTFYLGCRQALFHKLNSSSSVKLCYKSLNLLYSSSPNLRDILNESPLPISKKKEWNELLTS